MRRWSVSFILPVSPHRHDLRSGITGQGKYASRHTSLAIPSVAAARDSAVPEISVYFRDARPRAERLRTTGTSGDEMLKARIVRTGVSAVAIAGLVVGLSLAAGGNSLAAAQQRTQSVTSRVVSAPRAASAQKLASTPRVASLDYTCYFPISGFYCAAHVFSGAPLFKSSGALDEILPANTTVHVTCYYSGNPPKPYKGDGYQDHVVWENIPNPISGHVPDYYVNFDKQTPGQVGIPPC
jgi:hypothetical protein